VSITRYEPDPATCSCNHLDLIAVVCLASTNWQGHRVPQPDPTSEQVPLLFGDFDGPCGTIDRADTSARPVDRQHPVAKVGRLAALGDAGRLQADVAVVVVEQAGCRRRAGPERGGCAPRRRGLLKATPGECAPVAEVAPRSSRVQALMEMAPLAFGWDPRAGIGAPQTYQR
jgi:hypothetical protein